MTAIIKIYTDGACRGNPGPGGWAAILITSADQFSFVGHEENTTNVAGGTAGLNYTGTLSVQQYSRDGSFPTDPYVFNKCWPVNVAPIDLDWGTNDTIEEFTVEWAYDWWSNDTSASD